jgi:ABC-type glutathione transport system ATPase component
VSLMDVDRLPSTNPLPRCYQPTSALSPEIRDAMANLEEVFRLSGIPTYTFVQPDRYDEIKVSVRTPGRCLVLEGPSGMGKTTTVTKVLGDLGMSEHVIPLSARKQSDLEYIAELPNLGKLGTVIVDDFHRLDDAVKSCLLNRPGFAGGCFV